MPLIFTSVKFLTPEEVPKRALFDVYIVDDLQSHKAAIADFSDAPPKTGGTITIVLKSKQTLQSWYQIWSGKVKRLSE